MRDLSLASHVIVVGIVLMWSCPMLRKCGQAVKRLKVECPKYGPHFDLYFYNSHCSQGEQEFH